MKFFRKLAILALTLTSILCFAFAVGCKNETSSEDIPDEYLYKIRVQSEGGFGLRNVSVGLYDGDTLVLEKLTSAKGDAYFTEEDELALGEYTVRIDDIPEGWYLNDSISYQTIKKFKLKKLFGWFKAKYVLNCHSYKLWRAIKILVILAKPQF